MTTAAERVDARAQAAATSVLTMAAEVDVPPAPVDTLGVGTWSRSWGWRVAAAAAAVVLLAVGVLVARSGDTDRADVPSNGPTGLTADEKLVSPQLRPAATYALPRSARVDVDEPTDTGIFLSGRDGYLDVQVVAAYGGDRVQDAADLAAHLRADGQLSLVSASQATVDGELGTRLVLDIPAHPTGGRWLCSGASAATCSDLPVAGRVTVWAVDHDGTTLAVTAGGVNATLGDQFAAVADRMVETWRWTDS